MTLKGKRLFREITRKMIICEDSYTIPDVVSYYDAENGGDDIWFCPAEGVIHSRRVIISSEVYRKELGDWAHFRAYLKNTLKDATWMTAQASEAIQKLISFYAD